ncbi:hypothetical protein FGO68_gene13296 [Halteria grandinella]|uniref:RING-type domain-containing protein n=1 Tax=Halteria grandinella TaxID=5974 RepID=A0A8J8NP59_HALGN|nr:hypothetical protein FGO68_gene13296 [Halteria grandinella]
MRKEVLNNLPDIIFAKPKSKQSEATDDPQPCAICYCDFENGDQLKKLPCKHEFHINCIKPWAEQNDTCPLCRKDIK